MCRLLFIDDDSQFVWMTSRQLWRSGFYVCGVEPDTLRAQGLKVVSARPDIIVCDYQMGVLSGLDVRRLQLKTDGWEHLPFILYTSIVGVEVSEYAHPHFHVVEKSHSIGMLAQTVRRLLDSTDPSN